MLLALGPSLEEQGDPIGTKYDSVLMTGFINAK